MENNKGMVKMKKVAILTYHRHDNYGAVLQCYALQEVLKEMGCEVNVLDYFCKTALQPLSPTAIRNRGIIPCFMSTLGMLMRLPRKKAFQEFRKKLALSRTYTTENIDQANNDYDCFIVGSDNVWNPEITGFDKTYFLDFVKNSEKKNSYAASMGLGSVPPGYEDSFKSLLSDFRVITTRERKAADSISELLNRDVFSVLDPTLLLPTERWERLATSTNVKKPYILAYQMRPDRKFVQFVNQQAKKLGCKTIFIPFPQGASGYHAQGNMSCGPEQWLGLFKDADFIITDSFHGCAFSILFHKKFAVKVSQLGDRIYNLLSMLNLETRIAKDHAFDISDNIDYSKVDNVLMYRIKSSKDALKRIINT